MIDADASGYKVKNFKAGYETIIETRACTPSTLVVRFPIYLNVPRPSRVWRGQVPRKLADSDKAAINAVEILIRAAHSHAVRSTVVADHLKDN
jgi:hypothetical protein